MARKRSLARSRMAQAGKSDIAKVVQSVTPGYIHSAAVANVTKVRRTTLVGETNLQVSSAGGGIAAGIIFNTDTLTAFSSYAAVFQEYRIRKFAVSVQPVGTGTAGVTAFYIQPDPASSSNLDITAVNSRQCLLLSNNSANPKSSVVLDYPIQAIDLLGFNHTGEATPFVYGYFLIYTDAANLGTTAAATCQWMIRFTVDIEFRGQI